MRWMVGMVACVACSSSPGMPTDDDDQPPMQGPFLFDASYTLDATITSATLGSATYVAGDTISLVDHLPGYGPPGITISIVAGTQTGEVAITPSCDPDVCLDVASETLAATVSWPASSVVVTITANTCETPDGTVCDHAD